MPSTPTAVKRREPCAASEQDVDLVRVGIGNRQIGERVPVEVPGGDIERPARERQEHVLEAAAGPGAIQQNRDAARPLVGGREIHPAVPIEVRGGDAASAG